MVVEDDDEDVAEVVVPEPRSRRRGKVSASPSTNGKPLSKVKGKGRAASTANGHKGGSEPVIIEELDDDEPIVAKPPPTKKGKTHAGSLLVEDGEILEETESASPPELERMKEERDLVCPYPQTWQVY
jgi:hypothetical protein